LTVKCRDGSRSQIGASIIAPNANQQTFDEPVTGSRTFQLNYRNRPVELEIVGDSELVLRLDGIVRKRRHREGVSCVYVWTNIELHWEEHHFIEARWWPESERVLLTVNGSALLDVTLPREQSAAL
jgi:hypothetical protein